MQEISLPLDISLSPVTLLHAGELHCMYELGKLRYIRRGKTELLRMIYAAVRDGQWGTLPFTIEDEKIQTGADHFFLQYTAVYRQEAIVYKAWFTIEGRADSSISFTMKGEALANFQKNRIGICVHHPVATCSGRAVLVTRPDGSTYQSVFPEMVSPHQPFVDMQQMQWTTAGGTSVQIFFEGDVFETEDQRNWSDSSYKTYSTALHIPFPVTICTGDTMQQQLRLVVTGYNDNVAEAPANIVEEKRAFPKIGYCQSGGQKISAAELVFLQKIPFHHYRIQLLMHEQEWKQVLQQAFAEASQLNTRLQLVIVFSDRYKDELHALLPLLTEDPALLYSILPLQKNKNFSPADLVLYLYPLIKIALPGTLVGYGTNDNFVDINRNQPAGIPFDFVSYSLYPQAHMTDNRSILENLDNQPDMVTTAKTFTSGKPVMVGPVTIKDHQDKTNPDKRQYTALDAHWVLMSIQQLALAESITFCELFGKSGLLILHKNELAQTLSVQPSMVFEMLAALHHFQPVWIIKRYNDNEVLMDGLLVENASGKRLFFKAPGEIVNCRNQ